MGDDSYRRVADEVVARIRSGELRPGARVPVADLEARFGRPVTTAALVALAASRWVVRTPGMGARVATVPPDLDDGPPSAPPELGAPSDAELLRRLAAEVAELQRWRAEHERGHGTAGSLDG